MNKDITPGYFEQFIGTTAYYRYFLGLMLTDGTWALGEECGAFWLMDLVASVQSKLKAQRVQFAVLDLTVDLDKKTAIAVVHNGNSPDHPEDGPYAEYHRQRIEYTTFPFASQKLFIGLYDDGYVAYLPSEH